jgi:ketosteroid isomerase-like protein
MTWAKLLASNNVTRQPTAKKELDNLRSIVSRSLKDVTAPGLSADARFIMAYDAARTLSLMIVRSSGYRPKAAGGHYNTFLALETADGQFARLSAYFDGCRIKRNASEYDFAGGVTDTDADGLLKTVQQFAIDAEAWIKAKHPTLT